MLDITVQVNDEVLTIINKNFSNEEILKEKQNFRIFRKGPYKINDVFITSQWNSYIKWKYFKEIFYSYILSKLKSNLEWNVLDIGANNGYYSFLLYYEFKNLNLQANFLLIDPTIEFYNQFLFIKKFFPKEDQKYWNYLTVGWQNLENYQEKFDLILCMGILYHHTDPYQLLKKIHSLLKKGGILILETIIIHMTDYPICLIPEKYYAGSTGIWFIPNIKAVMNFLKRTNYREIKFHNERFILEEMNKIEYLPGLIENLSNDKEFTKEGYPKPYRAFFSAIR